MLKVEKFYFTFWVIITEIFLKTQSNRFNQKIIGGHPSTGEHLSKYIVSIRRGKQQKFFGDNHICAGQILAPHVILTAAHCLAYSDGTPKRALGYTIVAGGTHRLEMEESMQIIRAEKILIYPEYNFNRRFGDLALILLEEELEEDGETVQRLPLNDIEPNDGWECFILGWGKVIYHGPFPDELLYANLTIFEKSICREYIDETKGLICAGDLSGWSHDTCQGDSGGPLICNGTKLAGIVSFGQYCGMPFIPGFYTDVYFFRDWIIENSAGNAASNIKFVLLSLYFLASSVD